MAVFLSDVTVTTNRGSVMQWEWGGCFYISIFFYVYVFSSGFFFISFVVYYVFIGIRSSEYLLSVSTF